MSLLFDTGLLYAFLNKDHPKHDTATQVILAASDGRWGQPCVSDYVIDELFTLIRARKLGPVVEERAAKLLPLGGEGLLRLELIAIEADQLDRVLSKYQKFSDQGLSFTDASHLVAMERHNIGLLATFDGGFEGLVGLVPEGITRSRKRTA